MPIQFPQPLQGNPFDRWLWVRGAKCPQQQRPPNLAHIGRPFTSNTLAPGFWRPATIRPNLCNLGKMYQHGDKSRAVINPVNTPFTSRLVFDRELGQVRWVISGVSRDGTGVPLGACRVLIFSTGDNSFIGETVSDGAGAWTYYVVKGWPFFYVEYKAGSPDVAGTSLNTLAPDAA